MGSIHDVFGGAFLKAEDLPERRSVQVYIESVNVREFEDGKKLEVAFRGKRKSLIANKTNARSIAEVLGEEDFSQWPGQLIHLVRARTEYAGRSVPCIRVDLDAKPPAPSQPVATPTTDGALLAEQDAGATGVAVTDDIPF